MNERLKELKTTAIYKMMTIVIQFAQFLEAQVAERTAQLTHANAQLEREISDRKRAEEALRQSEARYRAILQDQTELIARFWPDGTLTFVNDAYCRYFGLTREEIIGKRYDCVVFEEDRAQVAQLVNSINPENPVVTIENRVVVAQEVHWTKWINRALFDEQGRLVEFQAVGREINDVYDELRLRKRAEEKLRHREAQLNTIITTISDGILILDRQGRVLFANPAAAVLLNISLENLINYQWGIPVGETVEVTLVNPRGESRIAEMRVAKTEWLKQSAHIVALRDITARKQVEIALFAAKKAAEAASQAKSTFLANMSHELRTPLNGILGYAQILQRDKNCTPKQKDGITIIYQCGTHLLTLINDILDLSKIEAQKLELYPEDFHFPSFLTGVSEIFRLKAAQKSIHFTYLALNQLPTVVHADEKRLRQVLMNLLSNAIKFTDTGGVTFKVGVIENGEWRQGGQGRIHPIPNFQFPLQNRKVRFLVEDTGIGITSSQLEKIFLPFEQVGDSSHRGEGTGLGLAITQKLISMMNSEIFVKSTPGVGSTFWFDLDLKESSNRMVSMTITSTDNIIGYQGSKRKILVIDDHWENCSFMINILEPLGFELLEAVNGQEGLEKVLEFQPDLIITDVVMPVMDGLEMTRRLRQLPEFQNTIVIATSVNVFEADRLHSLESGCNDFIPKPVQAEELLKKIKIYLNLSWIYDTQGRRDWGVRTRKRVTAPVRQSPSEMVMPPIEELAPLYEAAQICHIVGVKQEAIRLQHLSPEYTPFATRVLELAEEFEYEEVVNWIDQYLRDRSQ